jgi:hypothetical protein
MLPTFGGIAAMVAWYKHDIPAWMDSTESLPDGAYRAHHVICQLIYLNEGPIRLNEQGIAGRCNQHILAFRNNLNLLLTSGRLTLNPDQTLSQSRADLELTRISNNRVNAGLGGRAKSKALKNNESDIEALKNTFAHKTREEKTREEKKDGADAPIIDLFLKPASEEKSYYDRSKEILGPKGNSLAAKLLKAKGKVISQARAALEQSASKSNPSEYIGAVIRGAEERGQQGGWGDDWGN